MTLKNTATSYGFVTKFLHWGMALLMIGMCSVGLVMEGLSSGALKWSLYKAHKATGITMLALVTIRLIWRLYSPPPPLPTSAPKIIRWSAKGNIYLLYAFLFAYPLSGFLMSYMGGHPIDYFGFFKISPLNPKDVSLSKIFHGLHGIMIYGFIPLFTLHTLGSLFHHFILKDNVLIRMLTSSRKGV